MTNPVLRGKRKVFFIRYFSLLPSIKHLGKTKAMCWLYAFFDELAYELMVFNKTKICNVGKSAVIEFKLLQI